MRIVGFVPARAGSTRVQKKNMQEILGVPLFLWAANNLNRVLDKNDIYVDSDSQEILELAKMNGFSVIERPSSLASNATDGNTFMHWEASNVEADIYIQHLPPMMFLDKNTLISGIEAVSSGIHDSAFGAIVEKVYQWDENGPTYDIKNIPNSFTLKESIIEGMGLYVVKKEVILNRKMRIGEYPKILQLSKYEGVDIDYPEDLEFARSIARGLPRDSGYLKGIDAIRVNNNNIKLLVLDIDGTLTDGGMYVTENGDEIKKFNTKDGIGIKRAQAVDIKVAFLSSGANKRLINQRADLLNIDYVYCGKKSKVDILEKWLDELKLEFAHVAYVGDDINDVRLIEKVGLFACPNDAVPDIKKRSSIVLNQKGGTGCVREFIDTYLI